MWANLPNAIKSGFWMMGAMISFTLMAISGRSLADKLDTFEIMTFRSFIGIAIVLFFCLAGRHNQPDQNPLSETAYCA